MQNSYDAGRTPTGATPVGGYDVGTGRSSSRHRWRWLWILLGGFGLWLVCIIVTLITSNSNLIPADILIGSFTVPVAAVVWNFDHRADSNLPMTRIFFAFVVGGTMGILLAAIFEALLAWIPDPFDDVFVGLIEEAAKLTALIVVAQRLRRYTTTDGLVLGATVGFGFASLESSGYAFNALLSNGGGLSALVFSVISRGFLAPLGHGLWTGVLGLFLFAAAEQQNRLRISGRLVGMYFLIAGIHFVWDGGDWLVGALGGGDVVSIIYNLFVGAGGVVVLYLSWNSLVRIPRQRAQRAAAGGYQTAAASSWQQPPGFSQQPAAPWQQPAAPWQQAAAQPTYSGYPTGPVAPPPPAWPGAQQPPPAQAAPPPQAPPPGSWSAPPDPGVWQAPPDPGYGQPLPPASGQPGQPPYNS